MLNWVLIQTMLWPLWVVRKLISLDRRAYMILRRQSAATRASQDRPSACPRGVLESAGQMSGLSRFPAKGGLPKEPAWKLAELPMTTKENYVKQYSIQERCYDGRLPAAGVVIDESSGSSGVPTNWVRSAEDREDVKRILQLNYQLIYRDRGCILLNCFALGPWATGMNVSMSLVDVGILKSIGPEQKKLENTLEVFGTTYRYLVFGYPPFIKSFVDGTRLDLKQYRMDLIVGGRASRSLCALISYSFSGQLSPPTAHPISKLISASKPS